MSHPAPISVYLHIIGALGLFVCIGLEWAILLRLGKAASSEQVLDSLGAYRPFRWVLNLSMALILLPGLHMTFMIFGWKTGWIDVGLATMFLIGFLGGGVTGRRVKALAKAAAAGQAADASSQLPVLWTAFLLRASLLLGVIYMMTVKANFTASIAAVVIALAAGFAGSVPMRRRQMTPAGQGA